MLVFRYGFFNSALSLASCPLGRLKRSILRQPDVNIGDVEILARKELVA
jgi:hypothetical protein